MYKHPCYRLSALLPVILLFISCRVDADGSMIDTVYAPYVQQLEKEFEYRALSEKDGSTRHKFGYGQALSDRFFAEIYLIQMNEPNGDSGLDAYEVELKWQLTEQGEFDNDLGLLFELENERNDNILEMSTTLLALHEWSTWIATGNFSLIYEWGDNIENEWETAFSGQLRYRHAEHLEPGLEIYQLQDYQGLGPVLTGLWRFQNGKKLNWEIGSIFGTTHESADVSWKLNLEYEFQ